MEIFAALIFAELGANFIGNLPLGNGILLVNGTDKTKNAIANTDRSAECPETYIINSVGDTLRAKDTAGEVSPLVPNDANPVTQHATIS